jgi:hypothetical protein
VLDAKENAGVEARNGGPKSTFNFTAAEKTALENWESKGFRQEIEGAKAMIQANYDKDLAIGFGKARTKFDEHIVNAGGKSWYATQAAPPYEQWASASGWVDWSFQESELALQPARTGSLPSAGTPSASTLALSKGAFKVTGRFKRVEIIRHWLDQELFRSRTWKLAKSSPIKLISAGQPALADPGVMPYLPVGLLLAKDLEISGAWSRQDLDKFASGSGTIGPFSLGGPKAKATVLEHNGQLSIKAEGIQVIGFLCDVLPKVPDPDPKLNFAE